VVGAGLVSEGRGDLRTEYRTLSARYCNHCAYRRNSSLRLRIYHTCQARTLQGQEGGKVCAARDRWGSKLLLMFERPGGGGNNKVNRDMGEGAGSGRKRQLVESPRGNRACYWDELRRGEESGSRKGDERVLQKRCGCTKRGGSLRDRKDYLLSKGGGGGKSSGNWRGSKGGWTKREISKEVARKR